MPDGSRAEKDAWLGEFCPSLRSENDLQLMLDEQKLDARLARPECYPGREADETEQQAIVAERERRDAEAKAEARLNALIADSQRELGELSVDVGALDQSFNGKMIADYQTLRQELAEQVESGQAALKAKTPLPEIVLESWEEALYQTGDLRKVLTSNLEVDADKHIKEAQARLQQLAAELKKLKESAKRIEDAVEEVEDGEKWVGRMLKLNDAVEMLENSVEAMEQAGHELVKIGAWGEGKIAAYAKLAKEGYEIATTSTIIEQGVKNLAQYNITLAIAGEGFASVEELDRALESKARQMHEAAGELQRAVAQKQRYEGQYNQPTKGKQRR